MSDILRKIFTRHPRPQVDEPKNDVAADTNDPVVKEDEQEWRLVPRVRHGSAFSCSLSDDARFALTLGSGGTKLWLTSSGTLLRTFPAFTCVQFLPGAEQFVAGNRQRGGDFHLRGHVVLMSATTASKGEIFYTDGDVVSVAVSPDGGTIAAACSLGQFYVWSIVKGEVGFNISMDMAIC